MEESPLSLIFVYTNKLMIKETNQDSAPNHVSGQKEEQKVVAQKPMSIEEYTKALRKEAEVAKLRATIAESMFKENLAMVQLRQLQAGQIGVPPQQHTEGQSEDETQEDTKVD